MFIYRFITEDGIYEYSYDEYMKQPELMKKLQDGRRATINLGKTIISYDRRYLAGNPKKRNDFDLLAAEQRKNPLRYYLPCCASTGIDSPMHQFVNDNIHTITGIRSGNRAGKTTSMWIKQLITRGLMPCEPHWEVFTENGVDYREWDGPKVIGLSTYQMINHQNTLWPLIVQAWTPEHELGEYRKGGKRWPNFQNNPHTPLTCGSLVYYNAASQGQNVFESDARNGWAWDEQGEEDNFNGADMRSATKRWWYEDEEMIERLGSGWHDFGLTPHKLPDRPDTGANTFIHRMDTGEDTKGMTAKFYQCSVLYDTPDWIYPEKVKKAKEKEWIDDPLANNNMRKYREGRARMYGDWHESSGLVYEDWDRSIHMIDPFPIPKDATLYRGIDHGLKNPFVCLYLAVLSTGEYILYDEYVAVNKLVTENVQAVIKKSRNKRVETTGVVASVDISSIKRYRELQCGQHFRWTVMDGRSFSKPSDMTRYTLGDTYTMAGLSVIGAKGVANEHAFPIVAEVLRIDPTRKHIQSGKMGAPKFYCFNTLTHFPKGIEHYAYKESPTGKETAVKKNDHEMDAFKYLIQTNPEYVKGFSERLERRDGQMVGSQRRKRRDRFTRY